MDWPKVYREIVQDPDCVGYAAIASNAEAAAKASARDIAIRKPASIVALTALLSVGSRWDALEASESPHAKRLLRILGNPRITEIDLDDEQNAAMISGLVTDAVFIPSVTAAIHALGDDTTSRTELLGLPDLQEGDVARVRAPNYDPET